MSNIDRQDFLEGIKMLSDSIKNKVRREVTVPLDEYEQYKRKANKYEEMLDKIYEKTKLILKNKVENTSVQFLYKELYDIYKITCKL